MCILRWTMLWGTSASGFCWIHNSFNDVSWLKTSGSCLSRLEDSVSVCRSTSIEVLRGKLVSMLLCIHSSAKPEQRPKNISGNESTWLWWKDKMRRDFDATLRSVEGIRANLLMRLWSSSKVCKLGNFNSSVGNMMIWLCDKSKNRRLLCIFHSGLKTISDILLFFLLTNEITWQLINTIITCRALQSDASVPNLQKFRNCCKPDSLWWLCEFQTTANRRFCE